MYIVLDGEVELRIADKKIETGGSATAAEEDTASSGQHTMSA
jgi:hypothetical protein